MEKILKIQHPIIATYTQHANLFAILQNESRAMTWLYSNYIELFASKDMKKFRWIDFYFPMPYEIRPFEVCKWLDVQKVKTDYVNNEYADIVEYLISLIQNGFYVNLIIDYRFISLSNIWGKNIDRYHDIMLYGFDTEKELFYCGDLLFDKAGRYSFCTCSFDELREAYYYECENNQISYLNRSIYSYRIKKECDYTYNLGNIIYWLQQYYSGEAPEYWKGFNFADKAEVAWGINCYDEVIKDLEDTTEEIPDMGLLCILRDHKKMMVERLMFIQKKYPEIQRYRFEYDEMYKESGIIINMAIKYNLTRDKKIIDRINNKLREMQEQERKVLLPLICELSEFT